MRRTCNHKKGDGLMCNADALHQQLYCQHHSGYYAPEQCKIPKPDLTSLRFDSPRAIQEGFQLAMQATADESLTDKQIGHLLYACQLATTLLKQPGARSPEYEAQYQQAKREEAQRRREERSADYWAMELTKREFAKEEEKAPTKSKKAEEKKEEEQPEEMSFLEKLLTDKYNQMMAEPDEPKATTSHVEAGATTSHVGAATPSGVALPFGSAG